MDEIKNFKATVSQSKEKDQNKKPLLKINNTDFEDKNLLIYNSTNRHSSVISI